MAREGVGEFLQYLERNSEFRNDFNIIVAHGVSAKDIITTTYPLQKVPSFKISTQIDTFLDEWGGEPKVRLTDYIRALTSDGRHPVSASMSIEGHPKKGHNLAHNEELQPEAMVVMDGMAVFEEDQLIGFLSVEDTRNYLWTQDIHLTTVSVPCGEDKYLGVRVKNSRTKINTSYINEKPHITVDILLETELQSSHCREDLTLVETYKHYEKLIDQYVSEKIADTISKVQDEFGVDIFGFGDDFYRQHPKKFKELKQDWDA
ncbi:hypothetical protein BTR23_08305 [Alkalihalophilus pseudofirmus]|nr:hypothetical protein BTR23_08305 [Alkalihalophilus pseudofirmus]